MINLLRNATHAKTQTRHTTGHGLHDGVGQVLAERRQHKHAGCAIDAYNALTIADIPQGIGREWQGIGHLVGMATQDHHTRILFHLGLLLGQLLAGINQILHALMRIRHTLTNKQYQVLIGGQTLSLTSLLTTARTEHR